MFWIGLIFGFSLGLLFYWLLKKDSCEATTTERDKVTDFVKQNGSITTDQAKEIGVKHLRSVVCKMKRDGVRIYNVNPIGHKARYQFK